MKKIRITCNSVNVKPMVIMTNYFRTAGIYVFERFLDFSEDTSSNNDDFDIDLFLLSGDVDQKLYKNRYASAHDVGRIIITIESEDKLLDETLMIMEKLDVLSQEEYQDLDALKGGLHR